MPNTYLKKKRYRHLRIKKNIQRNFDYANFKEQIIKEMSNFRSKSLNSESLPTNSDYERQLKHYIHDTFNFSTVMMINKLFNESKDLPKELRNNLSLHSIFIKVIRLLMMNELEIVFFSLLLDNCGWKNVNFQIVEYFIFIGMMIKNHLGTLNNSLKDYIQLLYPNIIDKLNQYDNTSKESDALKNINLKDVNEKFNILKRPYNPYCKSNFIDYNESVDRILKMSLPYSDSGKGYQEKNKKIENESKEKNVILIGKKKDNKKKKELFISQSDNLEEKSGNQKPTTISFEIPTKPKRIIQISNGSQNYNESKSTTTDKVNPYGTASNTNNLSYLLTQQSNSYLNYIPETQSSFNYNQIFNLQNFNQSSLLGDFLVSQKSEVNLNPNNIGLGRVCSGYEQSLFQRNSQQFSEKNDDVLQEAFFKPYELKNNTSIPSLFGEIKNNDNTNLNLNSMLNSVITQKEEKGNDGKEKDTKNLNIFGNSTKLMEKQEVKTNLLALYQKLKSGKNNLNEEHS